MKTKFKDVAHLYLGCEAIDQFGNRGVLVGIDEYSFILKSKGVPDEYSKDGSIKPILRPLSDMTDDELKQIAAWSGICSPSDWEGVANDSTTVKHKRSEATFHITSSGDCVLKASGKWKDFEVPSQQMKTYKQLIDWRFDLFNLLDNGFAVAKVELAVTQNPKG